MIRILLIALMVLFPVVAVANGDEYNGNGDNGNGGNDNTNVNVNRNTNRNQNSNTNRNTNQQSQGQWQGQSQYQSQGQSQSSRNTNRNSNRATGVGVGVGIGTGGDAAQGQSASISNETSVPRQAPPAFAPNLVAAPETCMGSTAVGASTPFGGVSIGTTYKSDDCELRMFARSLMSLGQPEAALALLAQNEKVAAALRKVGNKSAWLQQEKDQTPAPVAVHSPSAPRLAENTQSP